MFFSKVYNNNIWLQSISKSHVSTYKLLFLVRRVSLFVYRPVSAPLKFNHLKKMLNVHKQHLSYNYTGGYLTLKKVNLTLVM